MSIKFIGVKGKNRLRLTNMSMTFIDSNMEYPQRSSENVMVMDDGNINVCLRSSGIIGGGA